MLPSSSSKLHPPAHTRTFGKCCQMQTSLPTAGTASKSINAYGNKFQFSDASQIFSKAKNTNILLKSFFIFILFCLFAFILLQTRTVKVQLQINIHFISLNFGGPQTTLYLLLLLVHRYMYLYRNL